MLSYFLRTQAKGGQEDPGVSPPFLTGDKGIPGISPPLEKGAGGILFHTVMWPHLFAPFVYFVVPLTLKAFRLRSICLSSSKRVSPCRVYPVR
jgi:hypothetical protein